MMLVTASVTGLRVLRPLRLLWDLCSPLGSQYIIHLYNLGFLGRGSSFTLFDSYYRMDFFTLASPPQELLKGQRISLDPVWSHHVSAQ